MKEKETKQVLDFGIRNTVTKKEMKKFMAKQKDKDQTPNFFVSFFRKFQFRKYRNRNKKLIDYKSPSES